MTPREQRLEALLLRASGLMTSMMSRFTSYEEVKVMQAEIEAALAEPIAHTDHPLRHWDRTCPACLAQGGKGEGK